MEVISEKLPVSVCIPVRNEEANLRRCLSALNDFDEVVLVDSGSTDATLSIANDFGTVVLQFKWDGQFPKKRNWALRNYTFRNPWILFLDADEHVTEDFVNELRLVLPESSQVGYWVSFTNWFMGHPLKYGDVFRKLALFRVGSGEYECFPETFWSTLDMEVHEHPVLVGSIGAIRSRIEHHDFRGLKNYIHRHNEYSSWEANRFIWLKSAGATEWSRLNSRQKFKYRYVDRVWFAWFYWFISVIIKRGFLDGSAGMYLGRMKRHYFQDVRMKIRDSQRSGVAA